MFGWSKKYGLLVILIALLSLDIFIFYLDYKNSHRGLTFAMLDVGQGDALFVESPTGTQLLIDAGPPKKVLSPLASVISPFDRHIDAFVVTNPDQDHIAGFLDVLEIYKVGQVFYPGTQNDSKVYQNLKDEIKKKNIPMTLVRAGMNIHLGGGAVMEILFPDRDVSYWDTNDGSIVARLVYGESSIMLTGDSTLKTEKIILAGNPKDKLKSTILKVGHHGSRTSSGDFFVKAVSPYYAVVSNGKDNKYGHPHKETLDTLSQFGGKILRTDLLGTIVFSCDRIKLCEIKK
jgi:competence protein ComEC